MYEKIFWGILDIEFHENLKINPHIIITVNYYDYFSDFVKFYEIMKTWALTAQSHYLIYYACCISDFVKF